MEWRFHTSNCIKQFYDSWHIQLNRHSIERLYSDIEYNDHIEHHITNGWYYSTFNHSTYVYHYFNWLNSYRRWNVQLE